MDRNDRQAIQDLFQKLAAVEERSPPRDPEAEAFIRDEIRRRPGAPYYMGQTIVAQQQALEAAQARIEDLEGSVQGRGGIFSEILGTGGARKGSVPRVTRQEQSAQSGGFLAGAAQTALGVTGGILLGNALGGLFGGGNEAQAAEPSAGDANNDAGFEDGDIGDVGGDF